MKSTGKNRAFPRVRTAKTMRTFHLKSILLGVLIWCGCDQNLRPLPEDGGRETGRTFVERKLPEGDGRVTGRTFEEDQPATVPGSGMSVSGTIDITPELFTRLRGSETLYIMARRGESGPPMAVRRFKSLQFPMAYTLTGADQMAQGPSFAGEVTIVARIDLDGNAGVPQAGDMEGIIPRVVIGHTGADVVIDRLY